MIDKYKTDTHHIYTLFCAVCFDSLIDGDVFAELWVMQFFTWNSTVNYDFFLNIIHADGFNKSIYNQLQTSLLKVCLSLKVYEL